MSGWEGITMMHVYALHQREHHIAVMLERTDRTVETEYVFQYLYLKKVSSRSVCQEFNNRCSSSFGYTYSRPKTIVSKIE